MTLLTDCGAELRKTDPDRFLLSLFAPASVRPALWALFCFDYEIARTRSVVTSTQMGLIRLQWWRDEIARFYQTDTKPTSFSSPVLKDLYEEVHSYDLPQEDFETLIYAREFDLEDRPPENFDGFLHYIDFTNAPLHRLCAQIIGQDEKKEVIDAVSRHFGVQKLLRSVPYMLSQRRCLLPDDVLKAENITSENIHEFKSKDGIVQAIKNVTVRLEKEIQPQTRFFKALSAYNHIQLKRLKKNRFDVFDTVFSTPPAFLALRLFLSTVL